MPEEKKAKSSPPPKPSTFLPEYFFEMLVIALAVLAGIYFYYQNVTGGFEAFFENPVVARFVLVLKVISAVVIVASFVGVVVVAYKNASLEPPLKKSPSASLLAPVGAAPVRGGHDGQEALYLRGEWEKLRERLKTAGDGDAAFLVVEADSLVDRALKDLRIPGETMGERLKFISTPDFKSRDDLWEAHKIRNQIAHGEGKGVLYVDALYAFEKFEKALKELDMI